MLPDDLEEESGVLFGQTSPEVSVSELTESLHP
jgi:hypothetical protein